MGTVQYIWQNRWHKRHLRTITAKLTMTEYDVLRTICKAEGTTPYAVMNRLVRAYMRERVNAAVDRDEWLQAGR